MILYHGGVRGLAVGDHLLPPTHTGATPRATDPDGLVYAATTVALARLYAGPDGWVYRVEGDFEPEWRLSPDSRPACDHPVHELVGDPESPAWRATDAVIVAIEENPS